MPRHSRELTREDWLKAGQDLLREAGLKSLRLHALTKALGISTGSFYHHFTDFDAFLGQLSAYYSGEQLEQNLADIRRRGGSPAEQLRAAAAIAADQNLPKLALAMRAWAESDPRAREAVRALDARLAGFFADCLERMGFDARDAAARSFLLIAAASLDNFPWPEGLPLDEVNARILAVILGEDGARKG